MNIYRIFAFKISNYYMKSCSISENVAGVVCEFVARSNGFRPPIFAEISLKEDAIRLYMPKATEDIFRSDGELVRRAISINGGITQHKERKNKIDLFVSLLATFLRVWKRGYVHADIKRENVVCILSENSHTRILFPIDWEFMTYVCGGFIPICRHVGTIEYMPLETILKMHENKSLTISRRNDIFACGLFGLTYMYPDIIRIGVGNYRNRLEQTMSMQVTNLGADQTTASKVVSEVCKITGCQLGSKIPEVEPGSDICASKLRELKHCISLLTNMCSLDLESASTIDQIMASPFMYGKFFSLEEKYAITENYDPNSVHQYCQTNTSWLPIQTEFLMHYLIAHKFDSLCLHIHQPCLDIDDDSNKIAWFIIQCLLGAPNMAQWVETETFLRKVLTIAKRTSLPIVSKPITQKHLNQLIETPLLVSGPCVWQ